jgi:hypothetical protein
MPAFGLAKLYQKSKIRARINQYDVSVNNY